MTRPLCNCPVPEVISPALALKPVGEQAGFVLDQCQVCKLAWTSPEPNEKQLDQAYGESYYSSVETKFNPVIEWWTRFSARRRARKLVHQHGTNSKKLKVLDIGCGRGVLLNGFRELGHEVLGIERAGSGFDTLADIESISLQQLIDDKQRFDLIVLWHVLEHLPRPQQSLEQVHQLLNDNGSLFVEVPNYGGLQSRMFAANWFHLDVPRHLFHFTPRSLALMAAASGFSTVRKSSFSLDQNLYGFVQSALNSLPLLPHNHLYSLLQSRFSVRTLCLLLLYSPLVVALSVFAMAELLISLLTNSGGVLSVQLRKRNND
ncbi:MAG: class I SAM-dependent methyltransferase [Gammaproteobacteria bacterium]